MLKTAFKSLIYKNWKYIFCCITRKYCKNCKENKKAPNRSVCEECIKKLNLAKKPIKSCKKCKKEDKCCHCKEQKQKKLCKNCKKNVRVENRAICKICINQKQLCKSCNKNKKVENRSICVQCIKKKINKKKFKKKKNKRRPLEPLTNFQKGIQDATRKYGSGAMKLRF